MQPYSQEIAAVFESLKASEQGLNAGEAAARLEQYGPNALAEKAKKPAWLIFLNQFRDFMILVLIAAAVISGIVGDLADTIIILVIVILNAIVGFVQEYRAEKAMEALKEMAAVHARVLRDGGAVQLSAADLVPGDVVVMEAGDIVAADMRLFEIHALRIEESSLTGESVPVDKTVAAISDEEAPLGDRTNMAYKGTLVINGRGSGVVVATGMETEIGRIAGMLQEAKAQTPLQKRMNVFGKKLSYIILLICVLLFGVGIFRGEPPLSMLLVAISLAVAAIPEALPALITIALARGAKQLVKNQVLIRKLPAVETLGSVTFICTDKTGTLTQNKMTVVKVLPSERPEFRNEGLNALELGMLLNHDVRQGRDGTRLGDPTEIASVEHLYENHPAELMQELSSRYPRKGELPFDSGRKCMSTLHTYGDKILLVTKGAVEVIVGKLGGGSEAGRISAEAEQLAAEGIRVLAYGIRILDAMPESEDHDAIERDLLFAGMVGMIDPPREEAKTAIGECRTAGINPVMITGDHPATAAAIAREIGILTPEGEVLTGIELGRLSPEGFVERVERIQVYARVSPEQKMDIVKALQQRKHFVAMTGDGVNDAPSLKASNIGVAMGINGTEVSKEAADMILLDDNFATIVHAVREGRRIYDNIRKFVKYIMTCNGAEIWTIFLAPLMGLPIPLLPIHLLWINLVTDGLPGLALSMEKADKDIMDRPPRKPDESLFADGIGFHIIWVGLLMAGITLGIQAWSVHTGNAHWQTMVFTVLSLAQLGHVMAIRSDHEFIYKKGFFSNRPLFGAVLLTMLLQLGVIYLPIGNQLFKTQPLSLEELAICVGLSAVVFHAVELEKWVRLKVKRSPERAINA